MTGEHVGVRTAGEETLGFYREGDSDGASRVKGLGCPLDLSEALSIDHDGKATIIVDRIYPSPDHLRHDRRVEKVLCETGGRPFSIPYTCTLL
jgi:hypothetical protein